MNEENDKPLWSMQQAIEDGEMIVASRKAQSYSDGVDDSIREIINQVIEARFQENISEILKEYLTRYQLEKILTYIVTASDFAGCKEFIVKHVGYHKKGQNHT